jgi:hypothetical protein
LSSVDHTAICECRVTTNSMIREICIDLFDRATSMLSLTNYKLLWATLRSSPSSVSLLQSKKILIRNHTKTCKWAFFPIKILFYFILQDSPHQTNIKFIQISTSALAGTDHRDKLQ